MIAGDALDEETGVAVEFEGEGEEDGGGYQDAQDALEEMIEEVGAVQGAVQWVDACWQGAVAAEKWPAKPHGGLGGRG